MKKQRGNPKIIGIIALLLAGILVMSACVVQDITPPAETATPEETEIVSETKTESDIEGTESPDATFSNSEGISDSGYWEGIKALDYVALADYDALKIPVQSIEVSDETLQTEIDNLLSNYTSDMQVTDRAVVDGDTINIDYVGSVDGVEFEGGSTQGNGTDVTIGVTSYIDDFLEQLIGHTPGETFDIQVTFPDPYENNTELSGKEAVFNVTINSITETVTPELTDQFVSENLTTAYGWATVEEMRSGIKEDLKNNSIYRYIQDYLVENSTVSSTPDSIIAYLEKSLLAFYQDYADMYGMSLDEFLVNFIGAESADQFIASYSEENLKQANYYLIMQAIAEDLKLSVSTEDVAAYFVKFMKTDDYSSYETEYGLPYLKQIVLYQTVLDIIADNAIFE